MEHKLNRKILLDDFVVKEIQRCIIWFQILRLRNFRESKLLFLQQKFSVRYGYWWRTKKTKISKQEEKGRIEFLEMYAQSSKISNTSKIYQSR